MTLNKQPMCSGAQLADDSYISKMTYKPSKLGHTDLRFGVWSEFISRSVHTGLQVSTCSDYDLCQPG